HHASTYYPASLDARSAVRLDVRPAAELTGADIRLIRTPIVRIEGRISGVPPGAQNVFVSLGPHGMTAQARPDGRFELWGPDPGSYVITANASGAGARFTSAPVPLEIGRSDVENIELPLIAAADIHGRVEFEDEAGQQPSRIILQSADGSDNE